MQTNLVQQNDFNIIKSNKFVGNKFITLNYCYNDTSQCNLILEVLNVSRIMLYIVLY
ncbi:hypothetical protein HHS_03510 [Candidatus Pantoea carbekii]|uniref:Uncharacterized protein n=1 Tax=Candidatus Pantoea carbekii TaxID=1235990 RepID=U3U2H3_9GAMM|nr:hypothetical protein HHS_03510 [Candidatus Pantoea carbekii]